MTDTIGGYEAILQKLDDMVKSRFIELFYNHPEWPRSAISDIVQKSIQNAVIQFDADEKIRYVDISSIDAKTNRIASITEYLMKQAPSRARQCIQNGDILVSTVRPNLKNIAVCNDLSSDLVCSTGFCVLRVNSVKSEFLLGLVTSDAFTAEMIGKSRGASYPAITDDDVLKFSFNMPPMSIQTKFSKFIHEVDKSKAIVRQCIEKYNQLVKSRFIEMFGDIIQNEKGWKVVELGKIGKFKTGGTPSSKHPEYFEGDIPWISSTVLGSNYIDKTSAKYLITEDAIHNSATSLIPAGSLIIGTRINVGESSINTDPLCTCQDVTSLFGIDNNFDLLFLKHCLDEYTPHLDSQKKGATIKGITSDLLKSVKVPLPPLKLQNQFADFVKQVDKSKYAINGNDKNKVD